MKVAVVFVRVVTKPQYAESEARRQASYEKHSAGYSHRLVVIDRYADGDDVLDVNCSIRLRYDGGGWDCGAWQFAARNVDADLLVCCNSNTVITGPGWLGKIMEAVQRYGIGLYGTMASNEVAPHIRTPCMIFHPDVMRGYPCEVHERIDTWRFESMGFPDGTPNVTLWCRQQGYATRLITWDGCYGLSEWRQPNNIFRKGDQSNIIVRDHHCEAYESSDADGRLLLQKMADG